MASTSRFTPERHLLGAQTLLTEAGRLDANAAPRARSQRLNLSVVAAGHLDYLLFRSSQLDNQQLQEVWQLLGRLEQVSHLPHSHAEMPSVIRADMLAKDVKAAYNTLRLRVLDSILNVWERVTTWTCRPEATINDVLKRCIVQDVQTLFAQIKQLTGSRNLGVILPGLKEICEERGRLEGTMLGVTHQYTPSPSAAFLNEIFLRLTLPMSIMVPAATHTIEPILDAQFQTIIGFRKIPLMEAKQSGFLLEKFSSRKLQKSVVVAKNVAILVQDFNALDLPSYKVLYQWLKTNEPALGDLLFSLNSDFRQLRYNLEAFSRQEPTLKDAILQLAEVLSKNGERRSGNSFATNKAQDEFDHFQAYWKRCPATMQESEIGKQLSQILSRIHNGGCIETASDDLLGLLETATSADILAQRPVLDFTLAIKENALKLELRRKGHKVLNPECDYNLSIEALPAELLKKALPAVIEETHLLEQLLQIAPVDLYAHLIAISEDHVVDALELPLQGLNATQQEALRVAIDEYDPQNALLDFIDSMMSAEDPTAWQINQLLDRLPFEQEDKQDLKERLNERSPTGYRDFVEKLLLFWQRNFRGPNPLVFSEWLALLSDDDLNSLIVKYLRHTGMFYVWYRLMYELSLERYRIHEAALLAALMPVASSAKQIAANTLPPVGAPSEAMHTFLLTCAPEYLNKLLPVLIRDRVFEATGYAVLAECLSRLAGDLGANKQLIDSLGDVIADLSWERWRQEPDFESAFSSLSTLLFTYEPIRFLFWCNENRPSRELELLCAVCSRATEADRRAYHAITNEHPLYRELPATIRALLEQTIEIDQ